MKFFNNNDDSPIGNGGGTCKTIEDVKRFIKTAIGAIEIGSITEVERGGNEGNTFHPGRGYTLNSLGLPNPGRKYYKENLPLMVQMIHEADKTAIVNVVGFSKEEYASLTMLAFECKADFVVLNFGCPNVYVDKVQKGILSYDLDAIKKTTIHVLSENNKKACEGRIGIKLSPISDPQHLSNVANFLNTLLEVPLQANFGYIGFVTSQNTIPNCYDEDNMQSPVISPAGGLSGMAGGAVLPIALGQVKQLRKLLNPAIKIIGVGGVTAGVDVEKMMHVGADFVQMVSVYYATEDISIFNQIAGEYIVLKL